MPYFVGRRELFLLFSSNNIFQSCFQIFLRIHSLTDICIRCGTWYANYWPFQYIEFENQTSLLFIYYFCPLKLLLCTTFAYYCSQKMPKGETYIASHYKITIPKDKNKQQILRKVIIGRHNEIKFKCFRDFKYCFWNRKANVAESEFENKSKLNRTGNKFYPRKETSLPKRI